MGMAASQARLLQLTSRKNTIGGELERLSMQRTSLAREMRQVSKNYQNALSSKTLKWSNNSGATYVDLSYSNLMYPGSANNNTPYLITDSNGKVVLDSKYTKYAEMISPDGSAGGDWESNRAEILASLTGISAEDIQKASEASTAVDTAADKVNTLQNETNILKDKCTTKQTTNNFIKNCFGSVTGFSYAGTESSNCLYSDDYNNPIYALSLGQSSVAADNMQNLLNQIYNNVSPFLHTEDQEAFKSACDQTQQIYNDYINAAAEDCINTCPLSIEKTNNNSNICIKVQDLLECILNQYENAGGTYSTSTVNSEETYYYSVDRNSEDYKAYEAKVAELEAAKAEHSQAVDNSNQSMTSANESAINFYDQIFSAIAENGWTENAQVEDTDYLNQMLQNNQYYITTISTATNNDGEEYLEFDTSIASNVENIFSVNDSDAQEEALVEYEYQKSIINEKESILDTREANLNTELSAINEMIKGIETVIDDNSERNFSIMS